MNRLFIIIYIFHFCFLSMTAQQTPCTSNPIYRQFDFWLGDWEVYTTADIKAGSSHISRILDSCIIMEEWTSATVQNGIQYAGKSFNTYNVISQQWQQTWVDNAGGTIEFLKGKFENNVMEYQTNPFTFSKDTMAIRKLRFFNLSSDKVRQLGEISKDNGTTWVAEYDLEYRRYKTDEEIIRENISLMNKWFENDDFLLIASTYTNDGVILSEGNEIRGSEAIRKFWMQLEGNGKSWDFIVESIEIREDLAIQRGTSKIVYRDKNGKEIISDVNYTSIWKKQEDGDWKIQTDQITKR